jgi:ATP adenylyltransferase
MAYLAAAGEPPGACLFCGALHAGDDRRHLLLHRGTLAFLILNAYPYASGHLMAVPMRHVGSLADTRDDELTETMALVRHGLQALRVAYRPDGFNVGLNEGTVAGAGVPGHLHVHVVPRWAGDNNFMPVVADTRVLPEPLEATYDRLLTALRDLGARTGG